MVSKNKGCLATVCLIWAKFVTKCTFITVLTALLLFGFFGKFPLFPAQASLLFTNRVECRYW